MNEAVAVSLVGAIAALLGSAVGAFAVFRADDRRFNREARALTRAVLTDLVGWGEACHYAAEDNRIVDPDPQLMNWRDIASIMTTHHPTGLWMLLWATFQERPQTLFAYRKLGTEGVRDPNELAEMRFAFRRWGALADEVRNEFAGYYGRPWYRRLPGLNRHPARKGGVEYVTSIVEGRVASQLRKIYGDDAITDEGSLAISVIRQERAKAVRDAFLATAGNNPPAGRTRQVDEEGHNS